MTDLESLQTFFTNVSFNDDPKRRNKDTYLVQLDPFHKCPNNYAVKPLQQYRGILTWNSKIYAQLKQMGANVAKLPYYPFLDTGSKLDEFIEYEDKNGICLVEPNYSPNTYPFDISEKQINMFMALKGMSKHTYGNIPICGSHYVSNPFSNYDRLQIINEYKFCICFDDIYHPVWSWDYVTNKIFDCLKAKTLPIYYGCYNIDDIVPRNFYIDYRDFDSFAELNEYITEFDINIYIDIVEKAYEWVNTIDIGNVNRFAMTIEKLIKGKK